MKRPKLSGFAVLVYEIFGRLSASRPVGFGAVAAIPITEIFSYLDGMGIRNIDDREFILAHVQALDTDFRKHYEPKTPPGKADKDKVKIGGNS